MASKKGKITAIGKIGVTLLVVMAGILLTGALLVKLNISATKEENKEPKKEKGESDTVYVKLLGKELLSTGNSDSTSTAKYDSTKKAVKTNNRNKENKSLNLQNQSNRNKKLDAIIQEKDVKANLALLADIQNHKSPLFTFLLVLSVALVVAASMIGYWLVYKKKAPTIEEIEKRGDDPELLHLIKQNKSAITQRSNYRKTIRFLNKIKYQYTFLDKKRLMTEETKKDFIKILIALERDNTLLDGATYITPNQLTMRRVVAGIISDIGVPKDENTSVKQNLTKVDEYISKNKIFIDEMIQLNASIL